MPKGGFRPGGGRPAGAATKKTRAIAEKAAQDGITPLEVMINNMRKFYDDALAAEAEFTVETTFEQRAAAISLRKLATESAKDAAPFIHPKLANIEMTGKDGGALQVQIVKLTDANNTTPE